MYTHSTSPMRKNTGPYTKKSCAKIPSCCNLIANPKIKRGTRGINNFPNMALDKDLRDSANWLALSEGRYAKTHPPTNPANNARSFGTQGASLKFQKGVKTSA